MGRIIDGDGIVPQWPGWPIQEWRADRCEFCCEEKKKDSKKRKLEYNRYKKIEIYRYIKRVDKKMCIKFMKKVFKIRKKIPVKTAQLFLAMRGRTTYFDRTDRNSRVKFIPATEVGQALMFANQHLYYHSYVGIVKKRTGYFLIHVYEVANVPKTDVKIEILFLADTLDNLGPKENHRKNIEKVKSIMEMTHKIDRQFSLYETTDHTTYPGRVHIRTLIRRSEKFLTAKEKQELKMKRYVKKMLSDESMDWMH
ncbi:MAG: hypothetical protein Q7S29_05420 [Candidatus Peribacter sp.]|nr:hypothetical protein [Candidatus Peribacter sp.]